MKASEGLSYFICTRDLLCAHEGVKAERDRGRPPGSSRPRLLRPRVGAAPRPPAAGQTPGRAAHPSRGSDLSVCEALLRAAGRRTRKLPSLSVAEPPEAGVIFPRCCAMSRTPATVRQPTGPALRGRHSVTSSFHRYKQWRDECPVHTSWGSPLTACSKHSGVTE